MINLAKLLTSILFITTVNFTGCAYGQTVPVNSNSEQAVSAIDLQIKLRKLWDDQAVMTRNVMLCILDKLPGELPAIYSLVQNQDEIGEELIPYFGKENSAEFTELLYAKVNFSIEVFKAARSDSITTKQAFLKWRESSDKISSFLKGYYSKGDANEVKLILRNNIDLTFLQMQCHVNGDIDGDKIAYEKVRIGIQQYADRLSKGMIQQFPAKFIETKNRIVQN